MHHISRQEMIRKTVHLSSLWIPVLYHYTDWMLCLTLALLYRLCLYPIERMLKTTHKSGSLGERLQLLMSPILRHEERDTATMTGSTFFLYGCIFAILIAPKEVAITAICILIISDTAAAFVGITFGKHPLVAGKSVEGSAAFIFTALPLAFALTGDWSHFLAQGHLIILVPCLGACLLATIAELVAKLVHIDDNFTIPVSFIVMYLLLAQLL